MKKSSWFFHPQILPSELQAESSPDCGTEWLAWRESFRGNARGIKALLPSSETSNSITSRGIHTNILVLRTYRFELAVFVHSLGIQI